MTQRDDHPISVDRQLAMSLDENVISRHHKDMDLDWDAALTDGLLCSDWIDSFSHGLSFLSTPASLVLGPLVFRKPQLIRHKTLF